MMRFVVSDRVLLELIRQRVPEDTGWRFVVDEGPVRAVRAEHPASAGLVLELPETDESDLLRSVAEWTTHPEFDLAATAPPLEHPSIVLGVRTLIGAFGWSADEVRAVAYLMFESGGLTPMEAGWLAGFAAPDAPMALQPPDP